MKTLRFLLLAAVLIMGYTLSAIAAPVDCSKKIESFDIVVDYSGSMMMQNKKFEKAKIAVAKDVLQRVNATIPNKAFNGGLHTMTPNGTLIAQGPWDRDAMSAAIGKLKTNLPIFGRLTYMGDSLNAYESFISSMPRDAALILVTDGANNMGADFVETVKQIYETQRNLVVHVISFADTDEGKANIEAIGALNPDAVIVDGEELAESDAAVEKFVVDVFCGQAEVVLVLRGVNFAFDSCALDNKAMATLDEAAEVIKQHPDKGVLLTGWTDYKGSDAYNATLSQNRANSVKKYLAEQGIPAASMKAVGQGKSYKYDNSTDEGRYMNRRTEVSFE